MHRRPGANRWRHTGRAGAVLVAILAAAACRDSSGAPPPASGASAPAAPGTSGATSQADAGLAAAIASALERAGDRDLERLYALGQQAPLWLDRGALGADGREALALLRDSADEGLDPVDYDTPRIDAWASAGETPVSTLASIDVGLSRGFLRYLRDVHLGRVDPQELGFRLRLPPDTHDFVAVLRSARDAHRIRAAAADLRPALGQYEALRAALGRYRSLAAGEVASSLPEGKQGIHPGDPYSDVDALSRRLVVTGDLPPQIPARVDAGIYTGPVVDGVIRFQQRHGLDADGVLGARTIRELNVPMAWRARQLTLALERLRWLPDLGDEPLIAINIPMFRLWGWSARPGRQAPAIDMAVIVGRAARSETPVIDERLRSVIFRPYWNVPRSILRNEILPAIARDAGYLDRENMEIVDGVTDAAAVVPFTDAALARLGDGTLRVRQRPGPKNALGLLKFVLPNPDDIYMHDTPAQTLFARSRRDFSHGCVRLEQPAALAAWVLQGMPEWPRERIVETMNGPRTLEVRLPQPVRVILFYTTAAVMSADGSVHFAEDIYGRDRALDAALHAGRH